MNSLWIPFAKLRKKLLPPQKISIRPASLEIATENPAISEPAEYFTLQGVKVSGEPATAGIYLRKAGNAVSKVLVK